MSNTIPIVPSSDTWWEHDNRCYGLRNKRLRTSTRVYWDRSRPREDARG
ncbi:ubiquitin carboxyl-terminal hydrolase isozyme l3 [Moniliophthora roreri]|nr:ubiquitin carboxyl-terminal hydrolase isozyme l3 [Moniliophthora roreri]